MLSSTEEDFTRYYGFSSYAIISLRFIKRTSAPEMFGRPIHCEHFYIIRLSDIWQGVKRKIFTEIRRVYNHARTQKPVYQSESGDLKSIQHLLYF